MHSHDEQGSTADDERTRSFIWDHDNVELTTVGIDIGSSTSHLVFSRLHLQRFAQGLSSRFAVVGRTLLARSPVELTPFLPDGTIDVATLGRFVRRSYAEAGLAADDVDTGAVILTGVALERVNARAVADLFAGEGGRMVCASAGHNLEAILAAHGSGAVARSRELDAYGVHLDIGGGTSKICLVHAGVAVNQAAVAVGGRLIVVDEDDAIVRLESAGEALLRDLGIEAGLGSRLDAGNRARVARRAADVLVEVLTGKDVSPLAHQLMLTPMFTVPQDVASLTLSGGVAEFLGPLGAEAPADDLGRELADAFRHAWAGSGRPLPWQVLDEGIRATVIGASQFTVQVSGNTIDIPDPSLLPLRGLPVVRPALDPAECDPDAVSAAIGVALDRLDLKDGAGPVVVALPYAGPPRHQALKGLVHGLMSALPFQLGDAVPTAVVLNVDLASSFGRVLEEECRNTGNVLVLDGIDLFELDFVDIGAVIEPTGVVPVVVKSLAFAPAGNPP
jgi:ethanolamine utilization protein EutA